MLHHSSSLSFINIRMSNAAKEKPAGAGWGEGVNLRDAAETICIALAVYWLLEGVKYAFSPVSAFVLAIVLLVICIWLLMRAGGHKIKAPG